MKTIKILENLFEEAKKLKGPGFREASGELLKELTLTPAEIDGLLSETFLHPLPQLQLNRGGYNESVKSLFNDGEIVLNLEVWKNANIAIHSHNGIGAFKILRGKSFQQSFEFRDKKILFPGIATGKLSLLSGGPMEPGDVQLIDESFIHTVTHLEPTGIHLTLGTTGNPRPLYFYLFPALEIEHRPERDFELLKKIEQLKIHPESLKEIPEAQLLLMYLSLMDGDPAHALTRAITEKLEASFAGKIFIDTVASDRAFQVKYRRLFT
jgi:hypothetical protein